MVEPTPVDARPPQVTPLPGRGRLAAPLPVPLTRFVGREREIAAVAALLREPDTRLVTLTGPGGVGKTRLAIEVARAVERDVADGLCFVALAPILDPGLVQPTVARALAIPERAGQPLLGTLVAALQHRHLLLVLDNFEHLLAEAPAWLVELLGACPGLTVLVTSRIALNVDGEQRYLVAPLPDPDAGPAASAALSVFEQRASAVESGFGLDETNVDTVAAICRKLDGLPLGIELAAARIGVLTPDEILSRLTDRFRLLVGGQRDAPARLQSMRDAIGWSYDLLAPEEQAVFRRLSVFVGGFTLAAAEAVCDDTAMDVLAGVTALVDHSLVRRIDGRAPRLTMLETIREFALEQLVVQGEDADVRDRHARWVCALARGTRAGNGELDEILAIGPLEAEHANTRAALRWLDATGQTGALADLVTALQHHWEFNKHEFEGLGWYQRVLAVEGLAPDERLDALCGAGYVANKVDSPLAGRLVENFASLAEARGTSCQRADAAFLVAMHAEDTGDYARAEAQYPVARDQAERCGDRWKAVQCDYHLGVVALGRGELERAMTLFDGARSAAMTLGDPLIPAWCLLYQVLVWCERQQPARAVELLRQHPEMDGGAGYRQHEPLLRAVASVVACQLGDRRRAARLLGSAVHDVPMRSPEQEITERAAAIARRTLGAADYAREWEAGNRMRPGEVAAEIDMLLSGQSPPVADRLDPAPHGLSRRELEVLRLIAAGYTDQQIADALFIGRRTAEWHVRNVLGKLGVANRAEAAALAARENLLASPDS
jgi:non-specific serine/threonine protein kinase